MTALQIALRTIGVLCLVIAGAFPACAQNGSTPAYWQQAVPDVFDANDYRDAIPQFLAKAANAGHPRAQATLGLSYLQATGVPQNDRLAAFWLQKAAAEGHRAAEYQLR